MTAINVFLQKTSAHLLTDGGVYDKDGKLILQLSKVHIAPHINAVVSGRGAAGIINILPQVVAEGGTTFDQLKINIPASLRSAMDTNRQLLESSPFGSDAEIVVAGISEAAGPNAYVLVAHDRYPDRKSWTVYETTDLMTPMSDSLVDDFNAILAAKGVSNIDDLDPVIDGLVLMEMQRAAAFDADIPGGSIVGGFCQLTTVTAEGITSRIVHRWPDKLGERVFA